MALHPLSSRLPRPSTALQAFIHKDAVYTVDAGCVDGRAPCTASRVPLMEPMSNVTGVALLDLAAPGAWPSQPRLAVTSREELSLWSGDKSLVCDTRLPLHGCVARAGLAPEQVMYHHFAGVAVSHGAIAEETRVLVGTSWGEVLVLSARGASSSGAGGEGAKAVPSGGDGEDPTPVAAAVSSPPTPSKDGRAAVMSLRSIPVPTIVTSLKVHTAPINALAADGRCVVVGDDEGTVTVWDATDWTLRGSFPGGGFPCNSLVVRGDIAVGGFANGALRVIRTAATAAARRAGLTPRLEADVAAHARPISALALHPHQFTFAAVSEDCSVTVWSLPDVHAAAARGEVGTARLCLDLRAPLPDAMATGARFVATAGSGSGGSGPVHLAVAAYDSALLRVFLGV